MMKLPWIVLFLLTLHLGNGQEVRDSVVTIEGMGRSYSPKKAILWSFALPGAGQVYNRKYWKLPIVYGAFAVPVYFIGQNRSSYHEFRDILIDRQNGITEDRYANFYDDAAIMTIRDAYRKNLELSYFSLGFVYLLTAVDAFVDAHLKSFDIDEDLSIDILMPHDTPGIALALTF